MKPKVGLRARGWVARYYRTKPKVVRHLRRLAKWVALASLVPLIFVLLFEVWVRMDSYPIEDLARHESTTDILDRNGQVLRRVGTKDGHSARWRPLSEINPDLMAATIAVEDHRFWDHSGVDLFGVSRAVFDGARARRVVSGASTLSMQLARLVRPHPRSFWGKLGEAVQARRLERALTKEEILEQYLNRAPYGAKSIGVEAASQRYFGKPTPHLSLAEAALLAGLPKAPTNLNPLLYPDRAKDRQGHVLSRMRATGAIDEVAYEQALSEPLVYQSTRPVWHAGHFTDYVLAQSPEAGPIETSLDLGMQSLVETAVADHVLTMAQRDLNNAAVVVLDNRNCEIRAMVGSSDYFAPEAGMVNGALARRQPGSTLKPFTFAMAFEEGDTPATIIADVETRYGMADGFLFTPQNFSKNFSGPVMMGSALGRSLNIPAIKVAAKLGVKRLLTRLKQAGLASLDRDASHYGLGLTLGNGEVTLLELAQAYAMFARKGRTCTASSRRGGHDEGTQLFSEQASYLITDVLSDESLRIAAFGPQNSLLMGFPVAVKTGTSTNWRDNWAIGYTEEFTVAVWAGNFDGRSMNGLSGSAGAGPLFHRVMTGLVESSGRTPEVAEMPEGIALVSVCALSGHPAHDDCPHQVTVRIPETQIPSQSCEWHERVAIDRRNGLLAGAACPAQHTEDRLVERLPPEYASWAAENAMTQPPPPRYSALCPAQGATAGVVSIRYPMEGETFIIEPGYEASLQTVKLSAEAAADADRVTWLVDGRVVDRSEWPYTASWKLTPGKHQITARAQGHTSDSVSIRVR